MIIPPITAILIYAWNEWITFDEIDVLIMEIDYISGHEAGNTHWSFFGSYCLIVVLITLSAKLEWRMNVSCEILLW